MMERMKKMVPTEAIGCMLAAGWEGKMEIPVEVLRGMDIQRLIVSCARGRLAGSLVVLLCLAQVAAGQVPTPGFSREAALSAANKFRKIQDGSAPDQAFVSVRISEFELN